MKMRMALVGAAVVLATPVMAAAGEQPVAGCPVGKDLLSIEDTLNRIDRRIYGEDDWRVVVAAVEGVDRNGDGFLCSKQFKPNQGQDKYWGAADYVITQSLDNRSVGRAPS